MKCNQTYLIEIYEADFWVIIVSPESCDIQRVCSSHNVDSNVGIINCPLCYNCLYA